MNTYAAYWIIGNLYSFFSKKRISILILYFISFIFVGFRYETGFDWPVYKKIFEIFSNDFSIYTLESVQLIHSQETGFLLFLGFLSKITPNYEFAQAFFSFLFLYSFLKLSDHVKGARPAWALSIYFSFLLLSVGFSTVRQAFAISLFNIGLAFFLSKKHPPYIISALFLASVFVHFTSIYYVISFLAAHILAKFGRKIKLNAFFFITIFAFIILPVIFQILIKNYSFLENRILFYEDVTLLNELTLFSLTFSFLIMGLGLFILFDDHQYNYENKTHELTFQNLIILLAIFASASLFFTTLRDRVFYELAILFCIHVSRLKNLKNILSSLIFIFFGIYYQVAILRPPQSLAFIPYQNYLVSLWTGQESSGKERSSLYMDEFVKNTGR